MFPFAGPSPLLHPACDLALATIVYDSQVLLKEASRCQKYAERATRDPTPSKIEIGIDRSRIECDWGSG
jgi:hypothetical protein